MDIASLSTVKAQNMSVTQVGIAMLDKSLENMDTLGQGIVKMMDAAAMERSVNPSVGSNFDMLA
ncbi:MAG: YjfB family protein [Lachnospiraceae bacterium]